MSNEPILEGTIRIPANSIFSTQKIVRRDILSQIQGPGSPQRLMISKDKMILGRSPKADVQLRSTLVSRQHISLERIDAELICKDLDSHNGLLLNGIRVHSVALRDGDTLQIGDVVFVFHQGVQWTSS